MAINLDPLFYTPTMVKILREQGSSQHAMELAEKILEEKPDNKEIQTILGELKQEAKAAFERFRKAGKQSEAKVKKITIPEKQKENDQSPISNVTVLPIVKKNTETNQKNLKALKLQALLQQVQSYRRKHA